MDLQNLIDGLHPLEIKVIAALKNHTAYTSIQQETQLDEVQILRALQWLQNKKILELHQEEDEIVNLSSNGLEYKENGLPERRFLEEIQEPKKMGDINLEKDEIGVSLGLLKKKNAITMENGLISITDEGKSLLEKETIEEKFLKLDFPRKVSELKEEEVFAFHNLKELELLKKFLLTQLVFFLLQNHV